MVLHDNERATGDGSRSVYCAAQGFPYVNSEALQGHHDAQVEMLIALEFDLESIRIDFESSLIATLP